MLKKISFYELIMIWLGFVIVVGAMATGGVLTKSLNFIEIIIIVLFANLILGSFAAISGYISAESGKDFSSLSKYSFSGISERILPLYVPIILIFWFAIISSIFSQYIGSFLSLGITTITIISFFSCFLLSLTSYLGIKWIGKLSMVFVPIIFVLGTYAIFSIPIMENSINNFNNFNNFNNTLGLILGTWIMGALINLPDITKFAKTPKIGALIGFLGIIIGNSFNILVGAKAALISGQTDPTQILISLGFPIFGIILIISNLWTTNDNNMYSASLGFSKSLQINRKISVLILASIAAILTLFNVSSMYSIINLIIIMGNTASALGAVVISGYFLNKKNIHIFPIYGWISWILGALFAFYFSGAIGILGGFFIAIISHQFLCNFVFHRHQSNAIWHSNKDKIN